MSTKVTIKGQVTLPKAVRHAAGIGAGDVVDVRIGERGEVIIEKVASSPAAVELVEKRVDAALAELDRMGVRPTLSTDEFMALLRGDD